VGQTVEKSLKVGYIKDLPFIYLFIGHDGMQPVSHGPLEKQIKCLERERTNNPEVMPSSPMNKCKMQKYNVVLPFIV